MTRLKSLSVMVSLLMLFLFGTQLWAQSVPAEMLFIEGSEAYSRLDYCQAKEYFSSSATMDHCGAKMMLGFLHLFGDCTEKDNEKAYNIFLKLANTGVYEAKFMVGFCHQHGLGTPKDCVKAQRFYKVVAADRNLPEAHFMLAYMILENLPGKSATVYQHLKSAADFGHQAAAFYLGLYLMGHYGNEPNIEEARDYFLKSVLVLPDEFSTYPSWGKRLEPKTMRSRDNEKALQAYNLIVESYFLDSYMQKNSISSFFGDSDDLLYNNLHAAGEKAGSRQYYRIGRVFQRCEDRDNSALLAASFFQLGVGEGSGESMFALGMMHIDKELPERDQDKGWVLITQAAQKGYWPAKSMLTNRVN